MITTSSYPVKPQSPNAGSHMADQSRRKMVYLSLAELEQDQDQINVYGVVVDAS
jgi:hypothetical protein